MMKKGLNRLAALAISSLTTLGAVHAESLPGVMTMVRPSNPVGYNMGIGNSGPLVSKSDAEKAAANTFAVGIELGTLMGILGTVGVGGAVVGGIYLYNNYSEDGIISKNIPLRYSNVALLGSSADRHLIFELVKRILDNQPSNEYTLKEYIHEDLAGIKISNIKECFNYLCQVVASFPYSRYGRYSICKAPKLYDSATELKNASARECLEKLRSSLNTDSLHMDVCRKSNAVTCLRILERALPQVDGSHLEKSSLQQDKLVNKATRPAPQEAMLGHDHSELASAGVAGAGVDVDFVFSDSTGPVMA